MGKPVVPIKPEIEPIFQVPYILYRYDRSDDDRYYFRFDEESQYSYLSVTSFTRKSLGIGQILYNWAATNGRDYAINYARFRAEYGTQMHIEIVEILRTGGGDFGEISKRQRAICKDLGYGVWVEEWDNEMRRDILAFLKFAKDVDLEVVFAELPVYSDKYGLAGSIDMGAVITWGGKRVKCLIDFKSGKKGFFDEHELQLNVYKVLWNDLFSEEFEVTHVFNWAPNAWRTSSKKEPADWPTYKLKNQTNTQYQILPRMEMCLAEGWVLPPDFHMEISGEFKLESYQIEEHIKTYGISKAVDEEE